MAKMGQRVIRQNKDDDEKLSPTARPVVIRRSDHTLVVQTAETQNITGLNLGTAFVGGSIMREGFITETQVILTNPTILER